MMSKINQTDIDRLIELVGGRGNIATVSHCITRLRFVLNQPANARPKEIEQLPMVKGCFTNAGQFQVVIGTNVGDYYQALIASTGQAQVDKEQVKKASLTIEAAFALPLFFFGMVTMIHFMDVYRIQTEHLSKLCQSAKEAGMYAYVVGGDGVEEITLPDVYKYKPIGGLIPLPAKWQYNKVRVHAWTGADRGNGNSEENKKPENMVYVTVSGSVYHKKLKCSHLNLSVTKVSGGNVSSRRNENGEKYHACESCSRGQAPGSTVYITKSGNRYHNDKNCSGLKRSVRLVKESEAGNLHACKRCG